MEDFLTVVKTTKKVQNNIEKFESLSLEKSQHPNNGNAKSRKAIIELDENGQDQSLLATEPASAFGDPQLLEPTSTIVEAELRVQASVLQKVSTGSRPEKRDSAVFVQKGYLSEPASVSTSLPDDAREILKSHPGIEDVGAVLEYLQHGIDGQHDFDIRATGPKASTLLYVLVTATIPDLWHILSDKHNLSSKEKQMRNTLEQCFLSISGIEALLGQVKELARHQSANTDPTVLHYVLDVLQNVISSPKTVLRFLEQASQIYRKDIHRKLFWQTLTSLFSGSKVLATVSQAVVTAQGFELRKEQQWLANGEGYTRWLAKNIIHAAIEITPHMDQSWTCLTQLFKRGLALGHKDALVQELYTSLLFRQRALWTPLHRLLKGLPSQDQKRTLDAILHDLSLTYFNGVSHETVLNVADPHTAKTVSGSAALINGIISNNDLLRDYVAELVAAPSNAQFAIDVGTRRALILCLSQSQSKLQAVLEQSLTIFGDKVYMQHAPIVQQEALAHTIILTIAHLKRNAIDHLKQPPISTLSMRAVSNRLAVSMPRVRLLGMIVGIAMSRCVDEAGKTLDFGVEEMQSDEVTQLLNLADADDKIGNLQDLLGSKIGSGLSEKIPTKQKRMTEPRRKVSPPLRAKVLAIEEVSSSSDDEDDLIPYRKPDSDPEDSDEDPTLLNRNKPSAPVYIIDLIKQLQVHDKPDVTALALKTAPTLVRRKANFGTELSENIFHLAAALINIQDSISDDEQADQRLQALIACFISRPRDMSRYLTNLYFTGDLSLTQRTTVLTAIGLGTREIAGFTDHGNSKDTTQADFPSQRLPQHLQPNPLASSAPQTKKLQSNAISNLAITQAHDTIRPLALAAADTATGPNALKIRTFSSRMDVEKRKVSEREERTKRIPKDLYDIIVNSIYLLLCSPLAAVMGSMGVNTNSTLFFPAMVKMHLQTLTLILNTLGPVGMSIPAHQRSVTHDTLGLLLGLHSSVRLGLDAVVLPAMLHLLLSLIDVTVEVGVGAQERLITEFGKEVAELVNWANGLEGRMSVPVDVRGSNEVDEDGSLPWPVLAAGIAVRWVEMGKRFQGRMLGLGDDNV